MVSQLRKLLLCLQESVEEVVLTVVELGLLHALHEALDGEAGRYGKVVEFVEGGRKIWVLAEPFVELGDLADLEESGCNS